MTTVAPAGETEVDFPVLGMTCAACVRRVETAAAAVAGVARVDVNLPLSRARLAVDAAATVATARAAAAAIRDAGYDVPADVVDALDRPASPGAGAERLAAIERAAREEVAGLRRDAIVAGVLAAPAVALAMVGDAAWTVVATAVLATVVVAWPGRRYLRNGIAAVRHGAPDMNTLIALGAAVAWLASAVALARGDRVHVYFDAAAAIVAFAMLGKLLESRARARLADAVRGLTALSPSRARRVDGGDVDAAALTAGDVIAVRPGERVAADGTVVDGISTVDEALLTGEAMPVGKSEGSPIYAGTLNHGGALSVRVARAGADTAVARIARAVEDAQGNKAPIARLADRASAYFVPAVLIVAAATAVGWLVAGAATGVVVERAVAVLVIACPCALGLATPAAVAAGTARGAELGVLFKGGAAVEAASRVDTCLLDKTGTVTGALAVTDAADDILAAAAAVEARAEHPIAHAIVAAARARGLAIDAASDVAIAPSGGVTGKLGARTVVVGSAEYLALAGIDVAAPADDGSAVVFVAIARSGSAGPRSDAERCGESIDGALAGAIRIADSVLPDAPAAIAALRDAGIATALVSGDRAGRARAAAAALGIAADRVFAEVRPTGKAAIVAAQRAAGGVVAMVGDGVNDAPALAAADLGVAMASGTDLAAAVADVTLLRGIAGLPVALTLARRTMHVIRRNLVAAVVYNAVCVPIAAAGLLEPMYAAAAMSLSSVSVVVSSLGLRRWRSR